MTSIASPRGTRDILPEKNILWQYVKKTCTHVAEEMSYGLITVPTFEETALFQRSLGEGTDIIDKELFLVRGRHTKDEQYALRPEGTAGIVRAYIQNGLRTRPQPVRLYSIINLFRYERPQRGRYREHIQFDIEEFGVLNASADAWVLLTQWTILQRLGLTDAQLSLNSLGTQQERLNFREKLVTYLKPLEDRISEDSRRRLSSNPLRILDSKDALDQPFLPSAPSIIDSLGEVSREHLHTVQKYLETWNIPYILDPLLVRGLDYYSQTCFEWSIPANVGRPLALGGGGRYDALVTELGGSETGAVGGGLGLDRIVDLLEERGWTPPTTAIKIAVIRATDDAQLAARIIPTLLADKLTVWTDFSRPSLSSQLKAASKENCSYALIVDKESMQLKNLSDSSQRTILLSEVAAAVA